MSEDEGIDRNLTKCAGETDRFGLNRSVRGIFAKFSNISESGERVVFSDWKRHSKKDPLKVVGTTLCLPNSAPKVVFWALFVFSQEKIAENMSDLSHSFVLSTMYGDELDIVSSFCTEGIAEVGLGEEFVKRTLAV